MVTFSTAQVYTLTVSLIECNLVDIIYFETLASKNLIIKFKLLQNNNLIARSYIYYNVEPTLFSIYLEILH